MQLKHNNESTEPRIKLKIKRLHDGSHSSQSLSSKNKYHSTPNIFENSMKHPMRNGLSGLNEDYFSDVKNSSYECNIDESELDAPNNVFQKKDLGSEAIASAIPLLLPIFLARHEDNELFDDTSINHVEPGPCLTVEKKDVGVMTDPEVLGPCEPGTHISLPGVVWSESTDSGMLTINARWRGQIYHGMLIDASQESWSFTSLPKYRDICLKLANKSKYDRKCKKSSGFSYNEKSRKRRNARSKKTTEIFHENESDSLPVIPEAKEEKSLASSISSENFLPCTHCGCLKKFCSQIALDYHTNHSHKKHGLQKQGQTTSDGLVCAVARSHKNSRHGGHHELNRADTTNAKTVRPLNLLHSRNVIDETDSNKSNVSTLEVCDDIESSELKVSIQLVNNSQDDNHDKEGNWYEMLPETSIDVESMDHTICDKDFEAGYNHKVQESSSSSNQQFPLSETYYTTTDYRALSSDLIALSAPEYPPLSSNTAFATPGDPASLFMPPGYQSSSSDAVFKADFGTISFDTTSFEAPSFNTAFRAADYEVPSSDAMFMTSDYQAQSSSTVFTTTGYQDPSSNNAITATGYQASSAEDVFMTSDYLSLSNRVFATTDHPAQSFDTVFMHADYPASLSNKEFATEYGTSSLDAMFTTSRCPVPSPNTEPTTIGNQAPLSGISSIETVVAASYETPSVEAFTATDDDAPDTVFMLDCGAPSFDPLTISETNDYGAMLCDMVDTMSETTDHHGSLSKQLESHRASILPDTTNVHDLSASVIQCSGVPTPCVSTPGVPTGVPTPGVPTLGVPGVPLPGVPTPCVSTPGVPTGVPTLGVPGVPIPGVPTPGVSTPSVPGVPISGVPTPGVSTLSDRTPDDQAPLSVDLGRISPVYSDISDSIDEAPLYAKTADTIFSSGPSLSIIEDQNMMLYRRDVTTESQPSHVASDQRIQNWCADSQATTLAKFSETAMNPLTFPLQTPQNASFVYRTMYFQRVQTPQGSYYTPLTYPSSCNELSNSTNNDPNKSSDAASQK